MTYNVSLLNNKSIKLDSVPKMYSNCRKNFTRNLVYVRLMF